MKQFIVMLAILAISSVASLLEPFWGIMLYYWLAVLRPHYLWQWALPFELRWSLYAALVALATAAINFNQISEKLRSNTIANLIVIYSFLLILSVLSAYNTATAQTWGIEYGKIILMALIATLVIQHLWQIKAMAMMVMLMLGYVAWEINSLYLFDNRLDIFHNGYGGLDNNGAGLLMAMGIPFAYAFATSSKRIWYRGACWILGILMLHAMLMSYSRGAMLAATIGGVWLLVNHRPRIQAALITVILVAAVSVLAGQEIRERFLSTTNYKTDTSANARFASWAAAWDLAWQRPLLGQGIRNSNQFSYAYGADRRGRTIHNQYLQVAADSGIPAAMLYIVILTTAMLYLHKCRRMCRAFLIQKRRQAHNSNNDDDAEEIHKVHQYGNLALGIQSSLVIFIFGAVFLSVESVELPWLLLTLAGIMPYLLERYIDSLINPVPEEPLPLQPGIKFNPRTRQPNPTMFPRPAV